MIEFSCTSLPLSKNGLKRTRELVHHAEVCKAQNGALLDEELLQIFAVIDLTTLRPTDTTQKIRSLAERVCALREKIVEIPPLAAICIPGDMVEAAVEILKKSETRVATVVNFPMGQSPLTSVLDETRVRLTEGADEIDLVFPLSRYLSGQADERLIDFVSQVKVLCQEFEKPLKTIIQSDELEVGRESYDEEVLHSIEHLAAIAYSAGTDMVKTSTGKGSGAGASFQAAAIISLVAKYFRDGTNYVKRIGHEPGVKLSGGIRDARTARAFMEMHREVMGVNSIAPEMFRFGASSLMGNVFEALLHHGGVLGKKLSEAGVCAEYFSGESYY